MNIFVTYLRHCIYLQGTVSVKVIGYYAQNTHVQTASGTKATRSILIGDQTATLELSLWGDAIEKLEMSKYYRITNVSSRKYQGQLKLTTTFTTKFSEIESFEHVKEDLALIKGIKPEISVKHFVQMPELPKIHRFI